MTDSFHSRMVGILKIALPLAALALLSTLFLFSRTIDPEAALPFVEVDLAERAREPRLTAPTWAGVTDDGAALTVTAAEVRPGSSETNATARGLRAVLELSRGGQAELTSAGGSLDSASDMLTLEGDVVVTTTTGWRVAADRMLVALERTHVESPGPVDATGPAGELTAGSMLLSPTAVSGQYSMDFNGGVRLIYQPPANSMDGP
jgi:lipopolysaccharide export system protein LptC